jgi:CDP-glucose 4,6-dehydratase
MDKDYSSFMEIPLGQRLRELPGPLLLTGHTGFKGTWMSFLLEHLNVSVIGYSLSPTPHSLFDRAGRGGVISEKFADVRERQELERFMDEHKPSTIIHMAAQPLVLESYENPRETFDVNVMGTANLLELAFERDYVQAVVVVTTDKVYKNDNSGIAFIETDPLEGKDPYSASKVGAEAVVAAWQQIRKTKGGPKLFSVRAGNVIGGGDYSKNRLMPDIARHVFAGDNLSLRNLAATRPWQHVLDVSIGYLQCLEATLNGREIKAVNLACNDEKNLSVKEVVEICSEFLVQNGLPLINSQSSKDFTNQESQHLNLNSGLAFTELGIRNYISQREAVVSTINWWLQVMNNEKDPTEVCTLEIEEACKIRTTNLGIGL